MQLKRYDPADEGRSYEGCSLTEAHMLAEKQSEWAGRFFGDVNNFKLLACRPPLHPAKVARPTTAGTKHRTEAHWSAKEGARDTLSVLTIQTVNRLLS